MKISTNFAKIILSQKVPLTSNQLHPLPHFYYPGATTGEVLHQKMCNAVKSKTSTYKYWQWMVFV
jgi:hypothetical protein